MSRAQLEQILRTVPYVAALGISVEEAKAGLVVLRIPSQAVNLNADGALHSGALFSVGELAASVALGTHPKLAKIKKLAKASRIEYLATTKGDVTAHAQITPEQIQSIIDGIAREGRAQLELPVQLMDGHGKDVGNLVSVFTFR